MASIISNNLVEKCLRKILSEEGYKLSSPRKHGETGVDILASKGSTVFYIEVIGFLSPPPVRSKDFYQVFFRAISRLEDGAKYCVIALPKRFERGFPMRVKQYKTAWARISKAFPELEIWLVDIESNCYKRTLWGDWLK